MKRYRIPLYWQMYGHANVEAYSLEEAIELALGPTVPLPEGQYVDDSVMVDRENLEVEAGDSLPKSRKMRIHLDAIIEWDTEASTKADAVAEFFEQLSYVDNGELVEANYDVEQVEGGEENA